MIPETKLLYNYDYAKRLHDGDGDFEEEWRRIIGLGADFEKVYEEYHERILAQIERYTGYAWEEFSDALIPIYLAGSGKSFSHPLTLVVDEDITAMIADCIHQLAHRNMYFGFPNDNLRDRCLRLVTSHVMREADLAGEDTQDSGWDLEKKTIREYLVKTNLT
ncbi:MAG: hypothetical protein WC505_04575 [Patescibacteria group bacterium]